MEFERHKIILLVEDETISSMLEKSTLEKFGFNVITADNGEKAINALESNAGIDLVLMDINLGDGMDGTEAAERILEKHELPLVFMSSHTEPEIVEKTDKITSYGYILKNSDETVLIASIKMAFKLFESKRKENEKNRALLESEERYHNIFNNCVEGLFQTTPEGRYRTVNQAFSRMFGFGSPAEMINSVLDIGEELYARPEDRKRLISLLKSSEGAVKEFEVELKRRDNSRFWVSISACMLYDAYSKEPFIEGTCLDITKRKMAEDAMRESEFKYRTLIEFSNDVIFCADKNGNYLYVNKVFASTFGKTPEYFYGKSFWDVYSKEHADQRFEAISKIFETGEAGSVEVDVPLPDKTLHFLATLNPIKDPHGNVTSVLAHSRNITERKLAEKALKESENKLREIIENSVDNIFVTDVLPDGKFKINTINGALEKFLNQDRKDVENKLIDEILPEIPARIISENFNKCLACGKNYSYEEVAELHGQKTYYFTNLAPVFDETGKAVRIIGISRNITKQKLAGEKIQNLLHEKELILSEVHHRVKNNMNTIYGLLKIQAVAQKNKEANDVLQNAAGRVLSMSVLYDKLYRSEDNGAISIKKYLPALVDEIVGIFPQKHALKIETSIDEVILSSKILSPIGMIINELISNTMKHAFNGRDEGFIAVTASKKEDRMFIMVMDNGHGIPESVTFDNSPGLGLRLVEMLVKQINGSITIERERGAKFIIEFEA